MPRAVCDGIGIGLAYHQYPAYEPDLDVFAVDAAATFVAFCLCKLHQVADSQDEDAAGKFGVSGTRPIQWMTKEIAPTQ